MNIEVTIEGKASISVAQEGVWSRRDLEALTTKLHSLANASATGKPSRVGFSGGSSIDTEVVEE